ncbi:MAG: hypothetical protein RIB43_11380 [Rhodospirillaceae bacterium]
MNGAVIDQRLKPLAAELKAGRYKVLSLDIFDTLMWRRVPNPVDVFLSVGELLRDGDLLAPWISVVQFSELRAAAEKVARAKAEASTGSREVLLADIYAAFPDHAWLRPGAARAAALAEAATEAEVMVLDQGIVSLIDLAWDSDVRVVFTSDTYFTRDELLGFLARAGLPPEKLPETIYISNEQGRPKWRDLFDIVLKDLGITPEQLVHVGDNVDADVKPCAARGIAHVFYDKWGGLPRAQSRELPNDVKRTAVWFSAEGDAGLTGLRSRLAYRAPEDVPDHLKSYWVYGAVTLAPLFCAYAQWVVDTSAQNKSVVFGIMREGRFLARLVSHVSRCLSSEVAAGELWLSRRAVVRAALWPDDLSLLGQAVSYCPGPTTDDVLSQLGVSRSDLVGVFQDPNAFDLHVPGGMNAFLTAVSRTPALQQKLTDASARRRKALVKYVAEQFESANGDGVILLDLGYAGTIQTVLQKILIRESKPHLLSGLYIAINAKGRENILAGSDLRALAGRGGFQSTLARLLERTPDILEHACMCPEGSLDGFGEDGQPEFLPSQRSPEQITQMEMVQQGILDGATAIFETLGRDAVGSDAFLETAADIVEQAILYPSPEEVSSIGGWLHEANFDLKDQRTLTDLRVDATRLEYSDVSLWTSLGREEVYWPQAALSKAASDLMDVNAAVSKGVLDPNQMGTKIAIGALTLTPDIGVGLDHRNAIQIPAKLTAHGRGEIQAEVKDFNPSAYQAIEIKFPESAAAIVIDQCAVLYRGEAEQKVLDVTRNIKLNETMVVAGQVAVLDARAGYMMLDLSATIPPWPHSLELLLRFKYLRLDPVYSSRTK